MVRAWARMLRYVRIEQNRRSLGAEPAVDPADIVLPTNLAVPTAVVVEEGKDDAEKKRMLIEYDDAYESAKGIESELDDIFEEKSSSLFSFAWSGDKTDDGDQAKAPALRRLMWYSRITALLHGVVAIIILCVNLNDESSHDLKTLTTKTLHTWVGANASAVAPVRDFGTNPRDSNASIFIKNSDKCIIAGDVQSRSRSFRVREVTVEVGELDIRWMIFAFFTLSCVFQLSGTYPADAYNRQLKWGRSRRSHLFEYSVSASLMMMALCAQVGVTDVYILTNVFTNTFACMIFGLLSDVLADSNEIDRGHVEKNACQKHGKSTDVEEVDIMGCTHRIRYSLIAHLAGWVTLSVAVSVMISNIVTFQQCVSGISIPNEIFCVICMEAGLFCLFGLVQVYTLYYKPYEMRFPRTLAVMIWYRKIKDKLNLPLVKTQYDPKNIPNLNQDIIAIEDERLKKYISDRETYLAIQTNRIHVACNAEAAYITLSLVAKMLLGGIVYISAVIRTN